VRTPVALIAEGPEITPWRGQVMKTDSCFFRSYLKIIIIIIGSTPVFRICGHEFLKLGI